MIPVNMRTFVSTLFGSRGTITEKDFNAEDKQAIARAVSRAHQKSGMNVGVIGYGDYGEKPGEWSGFGFGAPAAVLVIDSFTDPKMRLETTLGMARYEIADDGSVTITDTYNFAARNGDAVRQYIAEKGGRAQALLAGFAANGWEGVLNLLGNMAAPESDTGRKVKIRLGRIGQ